VLEFINAAKLCGWDETSAKAVLLGIIDLKISQKLKILDTVDDILDEIVKLKYPKE
jgi:hypothetical protein